MLGSALLPFIIFAIVRYAVPVGASSIPMVVLPALCILGAVVVLGFSSLTVRVTSTQVRFRFGIGIYSRSIALDQIHRVSLASSRIYEGWGIRLTRDGMLYNVGGFDTVRLELVGNKTVRIGSDDADRLRAAIQRAIDDLHRKSAR
jgi:hypothetical protein